MSTIHWSNRTWVVRNTGLSEPGPNRFTPSNVSVDASGHLHLKIQELNGVWTCAEIHHENDLGFGTYKWKVLSDMRSPAFDAGAILGLFTYDWYDVYEGAGEVDIEFAKWGEVSDTNEVEYSVQPVSVNKVARNKRISIGAPPYYCRFDWYANQIRFNVLDGDGHDHWFTDSTSVPRALSGSTWPFLNLWLNRGKPPLSGKPVGVEIAWFQFVKP